MTKFRQWLRKAIQSEMAEVPPPGPDWGYGWSRYKNQQGWMKRGEKLVPAFTPEDPRLKDPNAVHSQDPRNRNKPQPKPVVQPAQPQRNPLKKWICGHLKGNGEKVVLTSVDERNPKGDWEYRTASDSGTISYEELSSFATSVKDDNGLTTRVNNPIDWVGQRESDVVQPEQPENPYLPGKPRLIPDDKISDEQQTIDAKFQQMVENPNQSHMMIDALAGTGKTTMLNHLAWKYGQPGQKWLYLVFNTKNRVEAEEKFPPFVDVRTTNAFLGEVLGNRQNKTNFPQTERMIGLAGGDDEEGGNGKNLEKVRILADSRAFASVMEQFGIPLGNVSVSREFSDSVYKTVNSLLRSIRYYFKEQVLQLTNLAKSFALDPRQDMTAGIDQILNSYDLDTELLEVKERITKYSPSFRNMVIMALEDTLGHNFMEKDYRDEVVQATNWMMKQTMPLGTSEMYQKGRMKHNLGEFRDFNDDLWYAAVHANEINWPSYDFVLADEVQDFNQAQKIMLQKLHEAGAKIVAVGDPNQSIYRFRGADSKAFEGIGEMLTGLSADKNVTHRLTKNFRSRKAIIDFANAATHVKDLKQGKVFDDGDGEVSNRELKYDQVFDSLVAEKQSGKIKQTAFLSRTNQPLVHAALRLLSTGVPFIIVGKDIAQDLKKHIGRITAKFRVDDGAPYYQLEEYLEGHRGEETEAYGDQSTKRSYLQDLNETTDALLASMSQFRNEAEMNPSFSQQPTVGQFKQWLSQKLGGLDVAENKKDLLAYRKKMQTENPIVLSSAHKAKGLEFSRVFILRDDLFPHPKANRPEDLAQEDNAKFVAYTRAMDELHILDLEDQPGYVKPGQ